jgi:hypothetical protein
MKSSSFKEEQISGVLRDQEPGHRRQKSAVGTALAARHSAGGTLIMAGWVQEPRVDIWNEFRSMKKYRTVVPGSLIVRRSVHQPLEPVRIENVDPIALAGGDELCLAQLG